MAITKPAVFGDGNGRIFDPHELALAGAILVRMLRDAESEGVWFELTDYALQIDGAVTITADEAANLRQLIAPDPAS